jgi:hypothetical protein
MQGSAPGAAEALPRPRVIWRDAGVVVGEIENISVALWRGEVTRGRFEAQRVGLEHVVRTRIDAGFLCLVEPSAPLPNQEMVRASADMIAIHRPKLRYVACVIEGDGLRAGTVRAILNVMRMLITGKVHYDYFATVPDAAKGFARNLPPCPVAAFVRGVEELRAAFP